MKSKLRPYCPISSGEVLKEELDARDWTQGVFAEIIGRPIQVVNEIIAGKKVITAETAILFSEALGTSAEFWLNLEASYRLDILQQKQQNANLVSRKAKLYSKAPIKELIKRRWIQFSEPIEELEKEVLGFLGIPNLDSSPSFVAQFRRTNIKDIDSPSLISWVRKAEIDANKLDCTAFDSKKLMRAIPEIISLSAEESMTSKVPESLCGLGVRMVFVPHLPKTRIDGAAFWLDNNSPVIALSLRLNRLDNFWFTLMHEIAHLTHHKNKNNAYLDTDITEKVSNEIEKEANKIARNWLIPPRDFADFIKNIEPFYSRRAVFNFANKLGIHPAIVVGMLQYEEKIPYTNLRNLLGKIRPIFF